MNIINIVHMKLIKTEKLCNINAIFFTRHKILEN